MRTIAYSTLIDAAGVPRAKPRVSLPITRPPGRGHDWTYRTSRTSRIPWIGLIVSASLHLGFLFGFNHHVVPVHKHVKDEDKAIQMVMPEIKDLEEPPPNELQDTQDTKVSVDVPTLVDVPNLVDVSMGLVQPLDVRPPTKDDIGAARVAIIPVNIGHGPRSDGGGLKNIFDLSQLDRIPEPISQVSPRFPGAMKRDYNYAEVLVEFIVDTDGNVRAATVVKTTAAGFNESAVDGVSKWRFRPGMKGGRKVNTRMRVPIKFQVIEGEDS